ncbi:MAG: DUF3466 family protein [Armatimonadota bacterium]|nr:DUF3466 family protein [Armatimonadota bacterium]
MTPYRLASGLALAALMLAGSTVGIMAQTAAIRYKLTDLGAMSGFPYSRAYGINNKGQVVGQVAKLEPNIEAHAVLWDGPKMRDIAVPEGLLYGAANSINDGGQVVGGSELENYGSHGFDFMGLADEAYLWHDGKTSALPRGAGPAFPFNDLNHAYQINNHGQIAGEEGSAAALWDQGKLTKLKTGPDYFRSSASAINDKGQVAGIVFTKEIKRQAAVWSAGQMQLVGTLPGDDQSVVGGINDNGQVVGSSGKNNSYWDMPFLWEKGKLIELTPLEGRTWNNEVLGINNHGQIVGCGMSNNVYMHAVLWENNLPNDLNDLIAPGSGLVLMKATAINDKGQIVGEARDANVNIHAFLLTPIHAAADK